MIAECLHSVKRRFRRVGRARAFPSATGRVNLLRFSFAFGEQRSPWRAEATAIRDCHGLYRGRHVQLTKVGLSLARVVSEEPRVPVDSRLSPGFSSGFVRTTLAIELCFRSTRAGSRLTAPGLFRGVDTDGIESRYAHSNTF